MEMKLPFTAEIFLKIFLSQIKFKITFEIESKTFLVRKKRQQKWLLFPLEQHHVRHNTKHEEHQQQQQHHHLQRVIEWWHQNKTKELTFKGHTNVAQVPTDKDPINVTKMENFFSNQNFFIRNVCFKTVVPFRPCPHKFNSFAANHSAACRQPNHRPRNLKPLFVT